MYYVRSYHHDINDVITIHNFLNMALSKEQVKEVLKLYFHTTPAAAILFAPRGA